MRTQLDPDHGAYRYMSGYLDGSGGFVKLDISEIATQPSKPVMAFQNDWFKLTAIGVVHGSVPALGYIVDVGSHKLAFSGDQNGSNPEFAAATSHADLPVMDHAVPEMTGDVEASLHARPSEIAKLATDAAVRELVLSHNMSRSLSHLEESLAIIHKSFHGKIAVAHDLMCFELDDR
jgi:ribonuclease BN (tRNA processing enzyme)